jgi:hypothetical protein
MSSDATTLPLRDTLIGGHRSTGKLDRTATNADTPARKLHHALIGGLALTVLVLASLLIVVLAANRPSFLSSPSHAHFFPHWIAGPLGGLLPGFTRSNNTLRELFTYSMLGMYVSYLLALVYLPRLRSRWAIAGVIAVHAVMFLAPPLSLTDIFNYVNYGRMEVVHNLNPYVTIPMLEPHTDPSFDLSNWHNLLSPYGPLFTLITFALVPLGVAGSFWAIKGILMLTSLGTIALVWKCARLLGRDPVAAIVFVGLNPVVLIWGLGGDHNDFIMVFCIVLGLYLLLRAGVVGAVQSAGSGDSGGETADTSRATADIQIEMPSSTPAVTGRVERLRGWLWPPQPLELAAGAAFVAAVAVKASGGLVIPVVLAALLSYPRRLAQVLVGMIVAGLGIALISLLAFGPHLPDLSTQSRLVTDVSLPNLLGLAIGEGGESSTLRLLLSGVLVFSVLACMALAWRRKDALTATGWATVALLVTLSWVLPWYVIWVLPLAALSRSRRLRITALALGVYLIFAWVPLSANVFNSIGFHPDKTPLGKLHQRYVKELLY